MIDEQEVTTNEEENDESVFQILYPIEGEEEKDLIKNQFLSRLKSSEDYMKTLYPSMISNYKKYCSVADPIKDEQGREMVDRANLFLPYPYAIVEAEMPRLAGKLPRARAFPKRDTDKVKVEAIQDLIYYSLDRMNFIQLQTLWMRQFAIYGWSPLYYFWRNEERRGLERVPETLSDGTTAYGLKRVVRTKYDDFWASVLDVFDCFFQPGVEVIEEGDFFFHREWVSAKDLRRMVKDGFLYSEVMEYLNSNTSPSFRTDGDGRTQRDEIKGLVPGNNDNSYGKFELMWMHEKERIVQVLDRKILARVGDNPNPLQEISIINCNLAPLVNEPIGVGTIESLAGLPDKLNALSNARLDNISLLLNQTFLANRNDQQTDFNNIKATPGNVILCGDVNNSIKPLIFPDLTQSSDIEVRASKQDMQFVSGISDYIMGTKNSSKLVDTATGVNTVVREGNAKFALKLSAFESGSLRKFIEVCHAYNMTYMPEKKRIHVLGPKGMELKDVTLDDILCECDFIVEPGSSVPLDQISRRDALMSLLDRMLKLPMIVRTDKFVREVLESFDLRNIDEMMIKQDGPESISEDTSLAEAENLALSQHQDVALQGNDSLHLGIHKGMGMGNLDESAISCFTNHIQQHEMKIQNEVKSLMMGGQNGATPNPLGAGPEGGGAPGVQGMGGSAGVPALPQVPAQ